MTPWAWALPLPSPKTVSISMPAVMYIMTPASATTVSPGSSSTSTNWMSSPSILKSISWARRPGTAGTGGGGADALRCTLKRSTSLRGVHSAMPVVKTSVAPSMLPFLRLATISLSATGPTWWPPTAIHHSAFDMPPPQAVASIFAPAAFSRSATVAASRPSWCASWAR